MSRIVLRKDWIAVFKVKGAAKVSHFNECLSGQYLLNGWTFCKQTWNSDESSKLESQPKRLIYYLQGHGHSKDNDYFYRIYRTAESDQEQTNWAYTDSNPVT